MPTIKGNLIEHISINRQVLSRVLNETHQIASINYSNKLDPSVIL